MPWSFNFKISAAKRAIQYRVDRYFKTNLYLFVIWRILFVWQFSCISIAVSLSTVVAFKSQREGSSTKASLKLFVSWPCKLPQPVEGFDKASVPEYIRDLLWAFSVQTTSMALTLRHTNRSKPTVLRLIPISSDGWVQNEDRRPKTQKWRPRQNRLKTLKKG